MFLSLITFSKDVKIHDLKYKALIRHVLASLFLVQRLLTKLQPFHTKSIIVEIFL